MRPKKSESPPKKLGRASSLARAASILGYPEEVIQQANKAGLPGFDDHDRVDCDVLKAALTSPENAKVLEVADDAITKEQAEIRRILLQCQKLDFQNSILRKEYIPTVDVDQWQTERAESLKRLLTGKIINELLPKLVGLNVPEMVPLARTYVTAIVTDFKKPIPK